MSRRITQARLGRRRVDSVEFNNRSFSARGWKVSAGRQAITDRFTDPLAVPDARTGPGDSFRGFEAGRQ